jgi:hypothetical protein
LAGEILTRPGYPWYLVDTDGKLRGIPPGVPERIFKPDRHPRTDVPLEICGAEQDLSPDAALITAGDAVRPWFLFTNGVRYGLGPGIPDKYQLDGNKLHPIPDVILSRIPWPGDWH